MSTPFMNLILPTVSVTPGPDYATENNAAFTTVDSHNHTSGQGAKVPTLGLNINANLSFASYYAISLGSTRFINQGSTLGTASDINCLYFSGGNLYANDASGNQIQMTAAGAVNAGTGNINGMGATTASVTYTVGNTTFTFWSNNNVPAALDIGAIVIRETGATSPNGITLQSPGTLAAAYALTLPTTIAATNNALIMSSSAGVLSYRSLGAANTVLRVNSAGTLNEYSKIEAANITDATITRAKMEAIGQQVSSSCGTFTTSSTSSVDVTNLTVTITSTGKPIMVSMQSDESGNTSAIVAPSGAGVILSLIRDAAFAPSVQQFGAASSAVAIHFPVSSFSHLVVIAAGTYTFKVQIKVTAALTANVNNAVLVAYELV